MIFANTSPRPAAQIREVEVRRINGPAGQLETDLLVAEEPLEIRIEGRSIAVVMRTPGEDHELAAGFLVTEGLVRGSGDLVEIGRSPHCLRSGKDASALQRGTSARRCPGSKRALNEPLPEGNVVSIKLRKPESLDLKRLTRHVFSSSSCGVCSKASIEAVRQQFPPIEDEFQVDARILFQLPGALAASQTTFKRTGGLHACALFDAYGNLLVVREDVGRHNALDKVAGWALLSDRLPLLRHLLLLSGRVSFEMMQKALAAGIPMVAAISAPSSLAVEFARESGQTLVGFLRGERMNVYAGAQRLRQTGTLAPAARRQVASKSLKH